MVHPRGNMSAGAKPVTIVNKLGLLTSIFGLVPIGLALSIGALMQIDQSEDNWLGKALRSRQLAQLALDHRLLLPRTGVFADETRGALRETSARRRELYESRCDLTTRIQSEEQEISEYQKNPHIAARAKPQEWDGKPCSESYLTGKYADCIFMPECTSTQDATRYQFACKTSAVAEFSCGSNGDLDQDGVAGSFTYRSSTPPYHEYARGLTQPVLSRKATAGESTLRLWRNFECQPHLSNPPELALVSLEWRDH